VRQDALGVLDVVRDEVALRQAALREEDLVRVRDPHLASAEVEGEGVAAGHRRRLCCKRRSRSFLEANPSF